MQDRPFFRVAFVATLLVLGAQILAADERAVERSVRSTTLDSDGSFVLENPTGSIEIIGVDKPGLEIHSFKSIRAEDRARAQEGIVQTQVFVLGDKKKRVVRTMTSPNVKAEWVSSVDYAIRVPRSVSVTVLSHSGENIRIGNITGAVNVKNINGAIVITSVRGALHVESINGNVTMNYDRAPAAHVSAFTVNGVVQLRVPPASSFDWIAETLQGDVMSALPLRVAFIPQKSGRLYHSRLGGPGPTIETRSLMGKVYLLGTSNQLAAAHSIGPPREMLAQATSPMLQDVTETMETLVGPVLVSRPTATRFVVQRNDYPGDFEFKTDLGNVFVGDVRGDADISMRAGEVTLGTVAGSCTINSNGGPINLGDVLGPLSAHTGGGDLTIRAARRGGSASTDGGNIEVFYAGDAINLISGGGDVVLRQATDDVHAETIRGDIVIMYDPTVRNSRVFASTVGGNVILTLPPRFAADIDATIVTSSEDANHVFSEFPGLSITRWRTGDHTTIHAVGKINGGGPKVDLRTTNGDIHLRSRVVPRVVLLDPHH